MATAFVGAELAIAKLLVGEVVGASKCGSGLLVDCETGEWWCVVMGVRLTGQLDVAC